MKIVRVALAVPLPRLFDYFVPDDVSLQIGMRVFVPLAPKNVSPLWLIFRQNRTCQRINSRLFFNPWI